MKKISQIVRTSKKLAKPTLSRNMLINRSLKRRRPMRESMNPHSHCPKGCGRRSKQLKFRPSNLRRRGVPRRALTYRLAVECLYDLRSNTMRGTSAGFCRDAGEFSRKSLDSCCYGLRFQHGVLHDQERPAGSSPERSRAFGIMSHATAALPRDSAAQANMTIRKPNTNASPIDSLMAVFVPGLRPAGTCKPASSISFA
jgi:hypothetical protein